MITTLAIFYQIPEYVGPLDPDPDKNDKKLDHMIFLARPINEINNESARTCWGSTGPSLAQAGIGL